MLAFSDIAGVNFIILHRDNIFDPVLARDNRLAIDPVLIPYSKSKQFAEEASAKFEQHFKHLFQVLKLSNNVDDNHWKVARKLLTFKEISNNCLGFGEYGTDGHAFGAEKREKLLNSAFSIKEAGEVDPYLLPLYGLLEKDVGLDLISDLTTNVILEPLLKFTERKCINHGISTKKMQFRGIQANLPANPLRKDKGPVILIPMDILREMKVANNWSDVLSIAAETRAIREKVNEKIGTIFTNVELSDREKEELRNELVQHEDILQSLGRTLRELSRGKKYNFEDDPSGTIILQRLKNIALAHELIEPFPESKTLKPVVYTTIKQFKHLIENVGYWKELYIDGKKARETVAQRLYYAIAFGYMNAMGIDLSAEPALNFGRIDFKVSEGSKKVIVEVKKSTNRHVVDAVEKQLLHYCRAEKAEIGIYLVITYGEKKLAHLKEKINAAILKAKSESGLDLEVVYVDAQKRSAPSQPLLT